MKAFGNWPRWVNLLRGWQASCTDRGARTMSSTVAAKPPNVLVLQHRSRVTEKNSLFQSIKEELVSCLGSEKYVVYPLPVEDVLTTPWKDNCRLLVVPATTHVTSPHVFGEVLDFLAKRGSRLLSTNAALNAALGRHAVVKPPHDPSGGGQVCRVVVTGGTSASSGVAFHTVASPMPAEPRGEGLWEGSMGALEALETVCLASAGRAGNGKWLTMEPRSTRGKGCGGQSDKRMLRNIRFTVQFDAQPSNQLHLHSYGFFFNSIFRHYRYNYPRPTLHLRGFTAGRGSHDPVVCGPPPLCGDPEGRGHLSHSQGGRRGEEEVPPGAPGGTAGSGV